MDLAAREMSACYPASIKEQRYSEGIVGPMKLMQRISFISYKSPRLTDTLVAISGVANIGCAHTFPIKI